MKEKSTFEGKSVKGIGNYYLTHTGKEKGITLIALVITIIVLLILAGVAILSLTGKNGVLNKATHATEENSHAIIKDSISLAYYDYQIEVYTGSVKKETKLASIDSVKIAENNLKENISFRDFALLKGYINEEGKIDTIKLTGNKTKLGNGTGDTDIYILSIKNGEYVVSYQGIVETTPIEIWSSIKDEENIAETTDPTIFKTKDNRRWHIYINRF